MWTAPTFRTHWSFRTHAFFVRYSLDLASKIVLFMGKSYSENRAPNTRSNPIQSNPNAIRAHFFNLVVQLWCCCFFLSFRQFIECAFTFTDLCSPNKIDMNLFGSLIFISSHSTFGHTRLNWTVHTAHCTSNTKNTLDLKQEMKNPNIKRCTPCAFSFSMLQH